MNEMLLKLDSNDFGINKSGMCAKQGLKSDILKINFIVQIESKMSHIHREKNEKRVMYYLTDLIQSYKNYIFNF